MIRKKQKQKKKQHHQIKKTEEGFFFFQLRWGPGLGPILRPLACEAEIKPLCHCDENNFLFQILPTSFQKNQKNQTNFYKPHIEIINEGIMLTNQYWRPAGNLYRFLHKSASLFI